MIDLKKQKFFLANDLQFTRIEIENTLNAYIRVDFNGNEIGLIKYRISTNSNRTAYEMSYYFSHVNDMFRIHSEFGDIDSIKAEIKFTINRFVNNVYQLFNLEPPDEALVNKSVQL